MHVSLIGLKNNSFHARQMNLLFWRMKDMSKSHFLENNNNVPNYLLHFKEWGWIIWVCLDCDFQGIGESVSHHAIHHPDHKMVNDDKCCKIVR